MVFKTFLPFYRKRLLLFDVGGIVSIAGLMCAFVFSSLRKTHALYLAEPLVLQSRDRQGAGPRKIKVKSEGDPLPYGRGSVKTGSL